ncbi:polysialyltransferase family glycosyltransferase [Thiomicrospira sp. S5]|uniref:polysialyltransferase family glycosyltransferase n=1 Tax=Thiomicrospira sp. S5 TaxID=1803865 RepID=UPI000F8EBC95|nr:polysialyltransferase family glycosyltransferase [Thiomicrospira sp. S5]
MTKKTAYYLVSTPLHLLVSLAVALSRRDEEVAKLFFVAQEADNRRMDFFRESMQAWQNSPFVDTKTFFRPSGKGWDKVASRKRLFEELKSDVGAFKPERVYVGNDRHLEFQWIMHQTRELGVKVQGIYLDEGLYTYVGRKASKRFSDRVIDDWLKKLVYGFWWQTPPTIGGSRWIDEMIVAYPDWVTPLLKEKVAEPLQSSWFEDKRLQEMTQAWLRSFAIDQTRLAHCQLVLTLPETNDMRQVPGYELEARDLLTRLSSNGWQIGVKYHPKDLENDVLSVLSLPGVFEIPANVPFEVILPSLPANCFVLGDMSTTILTTRLFRPSVQVMVMQLGESSGHFDQFLGFYERLGLTPKKLPELVESLGVTKRT